MDLRRSGRNVGLTNGISCSHPNTNITEANYLDVFPRRMGGQRSGFVTQPQEILFHKASH
jgi:hypothetical protein